jgi:hypothetical protein
MRVKWKSLWKHFQLQKKYNKYLYHCIYHRHVGKPKPLPTMIKNGSGNSYLSYICMNQDSKQVSSKVKPGLIFILCHMHIPINMLKFY